MGYFFHLAVGRMVSAEVFGEIESLLSLITIVAVPAATLTMVATKYSAGYKADNDKEGNYGLFVYLNKKVFFFTFPLFLISLLFIPYIKDFLNINDAFPLILVWAILFSSSFTSIANGFLNGWQKFGQTGLASVLGGVVKLLSVVIFIRFGLALDGAVGSFFLGLLVTYLIALYFLYPLFKKNKTKKEKRKKFDFSSIKKYILPVFWGNMAFTILGNVDMVLAKHNLAPQIAGQFGALTIVSKVIYMVTIIVVTVLFSMSAENNHKKNSSFSILKMAIAAVLLICFGSVIFYFVFPKFILGMFFGGKYNDVAHFLGWFSVLVTVYSFTNLLFQYFLSIHKTNIVYAFFFVSILETFAILVVGHTISAILIAVIISQVLALAISLFYLAKIHKTTG